jgi:REP-associated tyrosine transposase
MTNHVHLLVTPHTPESLPSVRTLRQLHSWTDVYRWSSYRAHAHGAGDALVSDNDLYLRLGANQLARQTAYRALFQAALDDDFLDALRAATNGGWPLGDARFQRQVADALGRRVTPLPRGRPLRAR